MIKVIIILSLALVGSGAFLFHMFRRGSLSDKDSITDEDIQEMKGDILLNEEELEDVVEATYEILKVEDLKDEEFYDKVTKIEEKINAMDDDALVEYVNSFFTTESVDHPLAPTKDKSRFEWEDSFNPDQ